MDGNQDSDSDSECEAVEDTDRRPGWSVRVNQARRQKATTEISNKPGKDKVTGCQIKPFPEGLNPGARRNEWVYTGSSS